MATSMGAVFTATLLAAVCCEAEPAALERILERHTDARGGATAVERVRTLRLELEISEPEFTVRGVYVATRDGYVRIDIYADGERVFTEALGPGGGWQLRQGETTPAPLSPEGERALRRGLVRNLYGLHEVQGLDYELVLEGGSSGEHVTLVETAPDGFTRELLIDRRSALVAAAVETKALHPDVDPTETRQETRFLIHEEHGGVLWPMKSETVDLESGETIASVRVLSVEVNPDVEADYFAPGPPTVPEPLPPPGPP